MEDLKPVKGNITNIPLFLGLTLSIAITAVVASTVLGTVQDATSNSEIRQEPLQEGQNALQVFDAGVLLINGGFYLAAIILATKIRTSPVFAVPSLIFIGISVWLSTEIANIYNLFGQTNTIAGYASNFQLTATFMQNLPLITLGFGSILAVVLYTGVGQKQVTA